MSLSSDPPSWFEYPVRVQPHHTDYGGVVWHGTYVNWMESARVDCLRAVGYPFERLVELGYDLPVVALDLRYRHPLTLGELAVVKTRLIPNKGVRLTWCYEIVSVNEGSREQARLCVSGQVSLVAVNMCDRKIVRHLPDSLKTLIKQLENYFAPST